MTVVAVSDSNNRLDAAEVTTNWTKITSAVGQEPDFHYQGSFSVSGKIGTSSTGHYLSLGASVDMTAGDNLVCLFKGIWTNKDILQGIPSAEHRIGSGTGDYYSYYIADDGSQGDIDYPAKGGWLISPIDPNVTAWRDAQVGTPALGSANYWATLGRFTGTSKAENVATDAVDLGDGLFLVGGTSTDPDGTFQDFVDDDEGDVTNGRFGHVISQEGVIYVFGRLVIGRTDPGGAGVAATVFTDSLQALVFPGGRVAAGWNAVEIDLGNAATVVAWANISFIGRGRNNLKRWFDAADEVDGTNEEIDIVGHGFLTGDAVLYSDEGGTAIPGLTDATEYFVEYITADAFALHLTRQAAYTAATPINITASGSHEEHSFRRQPDTRPDIDVIGTLGTMTATQCIFQFCRELTTTSATSYDSCTFVGCTKIALVGATMDGCTIAAQITAQGEALVVTTDLGDISNCDFGAGGAGHAIEITAAGVYALIATNFTGYGPNHKEFNALNDVDDINDEIDITTHGFSTGDAVYYSDEGGTQIPGLTDQDHYHVRAVTADAISLHLSKYDADNNVAKIAIAPGSDEDHAIYSADAAIYNSSGGAVTINVSGATNPSIRNSAGSSTTVHQAVTLTLTNVIANSRCYIEDVNHVELMNEEAISADLDWNEGFEAVGTEETWNPGITEAGSSTVNPNKLVSGVAGAPSRWFEQCLEVVHAVSDDGFIRHNFAGDEDPWYSSFELIVAAEGLSDGESIPVMLILDNGSSNLLMQASLYQTGGNLYVILTSNHDGIGGTSRQFGPISLDTPYLVEFYWNNASNEWEFGFGTEPDAMSYESGTLTGGAAGWSAREWYIGAGSPAFTFTVYYDRIRMSNVNYPESLTDLVDVTEAYDFGSEIGATARVRKSSRAPKMTPWEQGGTITADGLTLEVSQGGDPVAE